mmetsp:Transcript_12923/g.18572  ORF Transcript_12923/g.18572 Transcript_12923/m.18572 type:complete len:340 (-) Transcript_12923:133-1152(-)
MWAFIVDNMSFGFSRVDSGEVKKFNKSLWELALIDAAAGGVATVVADCMMHPVDTVKARLQAQRETRYAGMIDCFRKVLQREGARRGLYAGLGPVLAGGIPCSMIVFSTYQTTRRLAHEHLSVPNDSSVDFIAGAAGEICGLVTYVPSEVIAKRMQISGLGPGRNYQSTTHALKVIYQTEGLHGLYSGTFPTMLRDVPFTALQFMFFERMKTVYKRIRKDLPLTAVELGLIGFAAGGASAFITNPFDVVKTRMQTQASGSERLYNSTWHCLRTTVKEEGAMALLRGAVARVMWLAPASALSLSVYEQASSFLRKWRVQQLPVTEQKYELSAASALDRRK